MIIRKGVKIVFQRERKREIFDQSCKVHFIIAFQANENKLKAEYRRMCTCHVTLTSRSREKESKLKVKKKA